MSWSVPRLSTMQMNLFSRQFIARTSHELQTAGQEVSTGRRSDIHGDLGPRAASVIRLRASESATQAYQKSNEFIGHKLEVMVTATDAVRDSAQAVLDISIANESTSSNGAIALQEDARAALESIISTLNINYHGDHIFSGLKSNAVSLTRWGDVNPATGHSPAQVLSDIVTGPPTDAVSAQAMIDDIDLVFSSQYSADPSRNFEATFYNGTPELLSGGTPSDQLIATISPGQELEYGVRANESSFRDVLKGLAMLATIDVTQITDEATYSVWMKEINASLGNGLDGILETSARIGFNQHVVETTAARLTDLSLVQRSQIGKYENVDPYEAMSRMTNLESQLQASYEVSARLSRMSILNHM